MHATSGWRFFVDRGGTFTDCIGVAPTGEVRIVKVLSCDDAPLVAMRRILALSDDDPLPACELRLGTTLATNALLEKTGARCALAITRGFADLLVIGDQSRPDIFALAIEHPRPLHEEVVEIDARADPTGAVLQRPDPAVLRRDLAALQARGIDSLAILVLHGTRAPALERDIADVARAVGFRHIVASHEVASEPGALARGDTAVVDAATTPLVRDYLAKLAAALPGGRVQVMQSSGGLADAAAFRGRDAILSGPAGGVVATAALARTHGLPAAIGFDMGGTSTDVTRVAGEPEHVYETTTAGVRMRVPMLAVHTIAAGGGSICRFDGHRFVVGPGSVGADPGPLCYAGATGRHGDALALTDVGLALGRIVDDRFPFPLQRAPVERALAELAAAMPAGAPSTPETVAEGFFRVAVDAMAAAIRQVSIARGHDVREHALVVFGGAGGQHACAVARELGIRTALVHPLAGVLSAWGIGLAPTSWHCSADLGAPPLGDDAIARARTLAAELAAAGRRALAQHEGAPQTRVRIDARYRGTETAITLDLDDAAHVADAFGRRHTAEFGYDRPGHPVELVTVRVELVVQPWLPALPALPRTDEPPRPRRTARLHCGGTWHDVPVFDRETLGPGPTLRGPALVLDAIGTLVLEPGWSLAVDDDGTLVLTDDEGPRPVATSTIRDPVTLEIFAHRFMAIAEHMGAVLRRTALSTNIRERLDFSCAVFDAHAGLVANAPHLPVHLGAMGESVAAIARQHPDARPGDVFATNDPRAGGSHLPDITVVTPVFVGDAIAFWVASRGHHADVGGTTPGSMPPDATTLAEEGIVLGGLRIVRAGALDRAGIHDALTRGPWPARRPAENLADLEAQVAANHAGARMLLQWVDQAGLPVLHAYMAHVQDHAAAAVREAIARLPVGRSSFVDTTDDGVPIAVSIEVDGQGTLAIDFAGTAAAVRGNANAPRAVTVAAVLYVLRTLVGEPIPLNAGCLRPVRLSIPPGSLLDPGADHAVAAGNVETSQRIVDVLFAALGVKAASQGTMNNLTFGNASFGYYETLGGGEGATAAAHGRSAVHTHMTNTRITDPEVLEARFPVRLVRFAIRRGSGGDGRFRGGDGLVRELEFLAPLTVSLLADRRVRPPFGLQGGAPGRSGEDRLGDRPIAARSSTAVAPGDRLVVATPGGGGFGVPLDPVDDVR